LIILSHLKQVSNVIFNQFKKGENALNLGDLAMTLQKNLFHNIQEEEKYRISINSFVKKHRYDFKIDHWHGDFQKNI
jgi:hypothetical protein